MKKAILAIMLSSAAFSVFANNHTGGFIGQNNTMNSTGGFVGDSLPVSSVAKVKTLPDDAWVSLEGYITQQVGHELYEFKDNTGSIWVDIDNKYWQGMTVTPETKIRIYGEIEKEWMERDEVDVKRIVIIK